MTHEERWALCLDLAGDKRYMHSKRSQTVVLSARGTELATKTTLTTRGKVTQTLYTFTSAAPADPAFETRACPECEGYNPADYCKACNGRGTATYYCGD